MVQRLRIHFAMQRMRAPSLVMELRSHILQLWSPHTLEPWCCNKDPEQPKKTITKKNHTKSEESLASSGIKLKIHKTQKFHTKKEKRKLGGL